MSFHPVHQICQHYNCKHAEIHFHTCMHCAVLARTKHFCTLLYKVSLSTNPAIIARVILNQLLFWTADSSDITLRVVCYHKLLNNTHNIIICAALHCMRLGNYRYSLYSHETFSESVIGNTENSRYSCFPLTIRGFYIVTELFQNLL